MVGTLVADMRWLALFAAVLAFAAVTATTLAGTNPTTGSSTSKTDETDLLQKGVEGAAGVSNVKYKCEETLSAKNDISVKCDFTNTSKTKSKVFIICLMLDLQKAKQNPAPAIDPKMKFNWTLEPDPANPKVLRCVKSASRPGLASNSSYHLGCHLVSLKPGKTKSFTWNGNAPFQPAKGAKNTANDFWINYADTINLSEHTDFSLDEKSCDAIVGQGQFLQPKPKDPLHGATALWVAHFSAFKDPTVSYQHLAIAKPPVDNGYEPFSAMPCAPRDLPEKSPPLGTCSLPPRSPPPTSVDLNLYWFDSSASPGETYNAVLRLTQHSTSKQVRLVTNPPPDTRFIIHGGRRQYGSITACSTKRSSVCLPPQLPEGARTTFEVDAIDPAGKRVLFTEQGTFLQDTRSPYADKILVAPAGPNSFNIAVHAVDATTSPIAATLWYSTDGGASWQPLGLDPGTDILNSDHARTFTGILQLPSQTTARYYVVLQDALDNTDWWGPGTASDIVPETLDVATNGPGTVTSNPSGISCPMTCTATFDQNSTVTLTAIPANGAMFYNWGGDCQGIRGPTCTVTMSRARTAYALFAPAG